MTARQVWDHLQLRIFQLIVAVAAVGILWNLANPVYSDHSPPVHIETAGGTR